MGRIRIEELYTKITAIANEQEKDGKLVFKTDEFVEQLKEEFDWESVPKEVLADYLFRYAIATGLNSKGYRSVVRGNGLYVNLDRCRNINFAKRMHNNATQDMKSKEGRIIDIDKIIKELERSRNDIPGQSAFDETYNETGMIFEELTTEEILEILINL